MGDRHLATVVCGWRNHVTPAAGVASLDGPLLLGIDVPAAGGDPPWRLCRCLRCDAWVRTPVPAAPGAQHLPPPDQLRLPRRDKALRAALILRLIAIERGLHVVVYASIAVLAFLLRSDLGGVQSWVRRALTRLTSNQSGTGAAFNGSFVVREGNRLLQLRSSTLTILLVVAVAYAVLEGVEAVGLWRERRWAEYLTCVATVGFVPYEVYELAKSVSAFKVAALVVNLVVLVYLVWAKRLFGMGRLRGRPASDTPPDPVALFGRHAPAASLSSSP